ncbi:polyphenol oxidase family protein [Propionibacteriaceae bacterium G1746]|uniref:polyphenol oxidase family protein n=1 Tax=Aestuariimicrobium sp. G57 TaxID=3418485 RepID=UPI003C2308B2
MFRFLLEPSANQGVGVAFTDRHGGVSPADVGTLNLGRTDATDVSDVETNFERVRRAVGVRSVVATSQVHGPDVLHVDADLMEGWGPRSHLGAPAGEASLPVADAMVTTLPDVALCIRVADCVPVMLADFTAGVVGAAHAGRVGFLQGVLVNTVEAMRGLGAREIVAWIGPHVCGDCYEVPQQMADDVAAQHPEILSTTSWGTPSLDLGIGAELQLVELGVEPLRLDPCTITSPDLHSHRRDGGAAGRMAGLVWLPRPA